MTEQEARAFVVKLMLIWQPLCINYWHYRPFEYRANLTSRAPLILQVKEEWYSNGKLTYTIEDGGARLTLGGDGIIQESGIPFTKNAYQRSFTARHLSLFRLNCFRSGAHIEANYHERLEWVLDAQRDGVLTEEEAKALLAGEVVS